MAKMTGARLVALDWGTTRCRAYLMGAGGSVLAERDSPSGSAAVSARVVAAGAPAAEAYEQVFTDLCGEWLAEVPGLPVIACGMVGSNHGWAETPYRALPADLSVPGAGLTTVRTSRGVPVSIIPGLRSEEGLADVIRGEESQVLGALVGAAGTDDAPDERVFLLPGTHSKWVRVVGTTVTGFTTCMTGELYSLLTEHSTLSLLAARSDRPDWAAFDRGLDVATSPVGVGGLLCTAFSARTLAMTGALAPGQVEDYVSGLLIGHELAGISASWLAGYPGEVLLCGSAQLTERYRRALEARGVAVGLARPDAAATGMWHSALAAGLVQEPAEAETGSGTGDRATVLTPSSEEGSQWC
jgi:2-dehydro-3-deoxygalactonokinase